MPITAWWPEKPELVELEVEINGNGRVASTPSPNPSASATFKFDPNTGFSLNGKPLKLRGVSRHQDKLGKGWALTREDHAEDMALMKEMGVNSVRHAHYPHADEWVEEADKAGMIVWAEVPYVTTPSLSGGEGSAEVFANAEQQTRELIRQQYNHPSILMWAAGNEVDASALFGLTSAPTSRANCSITSTRSSRRKTRRARQSSPIAAKMCVHPSRGLPRKSKARSWRARLTSLAITAIMAGIIPSR